MKTVLCYGLLALSLFAGSGEARLNHFFSATYSTRTANQVDTFLYVTNISSDSVIVTITLYNDAGVLISDSDDSPTAGKLQASNATNYSDATGLYSMKFTLAPNATSLVWVDNPSSLADYGYGEIKWWNGGPDPSEALIAHAVMYRSFSGNVGYYTVQVNDGNPF